MRAVARARARCASSWRYLGEYVRCAAAGEPHWSAYARDPVRGRGPRPQRLLTRPLLGTLRHPRCRAFRELVRYRAWYGRGFPRTSSVALTRPEVAMSSPRFRRARNHDEALSHVSLSNARASGGTTRGSASARCCSAALIAGLVWYQLGVRGGSGAAGTRRWPRRRRPDRRATRTCAETGDDGTAASTDRNGGRCEGLRDGPRRRRGGAARARAHPRRRPGGRRDPGRRRRRARRRPGPAEPRGQGRGRPAHRGRRDRRAGAGRGRAAPDPLAPATGEPGRADQPQHREPTELEELPGIGPSLAAAIIAEREKRGGFKSVGQLQDVRGIGEKRFADIKDLVTV